MANEQNLVSLKDRSPRERKEISRKGAEATNKKKRETKAVREYITQFFSGDFDNEAFKDNLKSLGFSDEKLEGIDNKLAMIMAQWAKAMTGDTKAFENLLNYAGEKPVEQVQNINPPQIVIERPKE